MTSRLARQSSLPPFLRPILPPALPPETAEKGGLRAKGGFLQLLLHACRRGRAHMCAQQPSPILPSSLFPGFPGSERGEVSGTIIIFGEF